MGLSNYWFEVLVQVSYTRPNRLFRIFYDDVKQQLTAHNIGYKERRNSLYFFVKTRQLSVIFQDIDRLATAPRKPPVIDQEGVLSIIHEIRQELEDALAEEANLEDKIKSAVSAASSRPPPQSAREAAKRAIAQDRIKVIYDYEVANGPSRLHDSNRLAAYWKAQLAKHAGDRRYDEYIDHIADSILVFPFEAARAYIHRKYPGVIGAFYGIEE